MGGSGGEALSVGGGAEPVVGLEAPGEAALAGPADRASRQYVQAPTFGIEARNIAPLTGGSILISLVSQFTAAEIVMHMLDLLTIRGESSGGACQGARSIPPARCCTDWTQFKPGVV